MVVEMEVREIARSNNPENAVIVLGEKDGGQREMPILTDLYQAMFLEMAVARRTSERPLTHDLVLNVIGGMQGTLRRVLIDKCDSVGGHDVFFAKLDIALKDNTNVMIDSRSTDAIVLAAKAGVPIHVNESVLSRITQLSNDPDDSESPADGEE